jgi:glutamine amidotransferase
VRDLLTLPASTDSALLWALVSARLKAGAPAAAAVSETVVEVARAAPGSRLNLLLVDGGTAVATAWGHALSAWAGDGAALLSSEPLDADPRWRPVPDGHLVVATAGAVQITPLTAAPPATATAAPPAAAEPVTVSPPAAFPPTAASLSSIKELP